MNQYKQLAKNFLIYSSGAIILRVITALSTLITINIFNPKQFGLLALLNNVTIVLPLILGLGLRQILGVKFFELDSEQRKKFISKIIGIYLIISIPLCAILALAHKQINSTLFFNQASLPIILVALTISFISFFTELTFQVLRFKERALQLTLTQIAMSIIIATSTLLLVYKWKLEILGVLLAQLLAHVFICTYGAHLYAKKFTLPSISIKKAIPLIKTGTNFILQSIVIWIIPLQSRWVLAKYTSMNTMGIFSLAYSILNMYQFTILQIINNLYVPYIFKKFKEDKGLGISINNKIAILLLAITSICSFIYYIFQAYGTLHLILPIKYHPSISIVGQIIWSNNIFIFGYVLSSKIQYFNNKDIKWIYLIYSISNLMLNFILIPMFGISGIAISLTISSLIYTFTVSRFFK